MKSDRSARKVIPQGPAADAFQAFFDMVESPAALCDADLVLLTANPAFEALCGVRGATGPLTELMEGAIEPPPAHGESRQVQVRCTTGQRVTLNLSRRGDTVAVVARSMLSSGTVDSLAAAGRALIEQARIEQALLELGREVAGATSEEELVAAVARGVNGLFPGRSFCVRITDQRLCTLTSLYAEGRLRDGVRDTLVIKRSAAEKTHLLTQDLPTERVRIIDDELPLLFHGTVRAICAPLVASGHLFGLINVEYPEGLSADLLTDDRVLIQLANQVAVGVRNAKLIDELTFVRKYLEELLEHANALILVANRERKIVVFNKAIATLTGLAKEEVLGQDLLTFVPESERMRVMRVMAASLRGEQVANFETQVIGRQGKEVRVSFATSSVMTAQGEVEGVIAIGQDLTRMKELERRVIQAEKLTSLGQLAATVVHEINNPMTAVATYADALLVRSQMQPNADPADTEKFRKILENCERVLKFTRDLVSYARPAKDKPEKVDIAATLEMALGFCEHVLQKHGILVERQYQPTPRLSAVRANLVQVFVNLITNACHAMPPGGRVKLLTAHDGADVVIEVSDSGHGISPQDLEKVFEPFFSTKPEGKGTGLGLSIVQSIVENHGGTVTVDSRLDSGTTFRVRLPIPESAPGSKST